MSFLGPDGNYYPEQRFKRYNVNLESLIVSNDRTYEGFIQNVSEEGLAYESDSFPSNLQEFSPEKTINVILKMPSGETLILNCEIKWSSEQSPWPLPKNYSTLGMGMQIINPPETYREYVRIFQ